MTWDFPHFTQKEMGCPDGCGGLPKREFMEKLEAIRVKANFPFRISSGFRCAKYNLKVAETGMNSPHTMGLACDILVNGIRAYDLIAIAIRNGMTGIGVDQKGELDKRFLHLDSLPTSDPNHYRPTIWSY